MSTPDDPPAIARRKADHLHVAVSDEAGFQHKTTLLEQVHLIHQALPESALEEIDLGTELLGHHLAAPLVITGMTGGTEAAGRINRDLARAAQRVGIAFGVGSQRAMAEHPELESTYQVRDEAPDLFLIGNLGVVQARAYGPARVADLAARIGANAMAIHLNPTMELIQIDGDRDFRGAADFIAALVDVLEIPVMVKETGCGLSDEVAAHLCSAGVTAVDVSGAGGTSWSAVEAHRAAPGSASRELGEMLSEWGIPTAVSTALCVRAGLQVIASGGIRTGLDVARALALGATAGGFAAPVLKAHRDRGFEGALELLERTIHALRAIVLLCGCRTAGDLVNAPRHVGAELRAWFDDLGLR